MKENTERLHSAQIGTSLLLVILGMKNMNSRMKNLESTYNLNFTIQ